MVYARSSYDTPNNIITVNGNIADALQQIGCTFDVKVKLYLDGGTVTIPSASVKNGANLLVSVEDITERRLEFGDGEFTTATTALVFDNSNGYFNQDNVNAVIYDEILDGRKVEIILFPKVNGGHYIDPTSGTGLTRFVGQMQAPEYDGDFCRIKCRDILSFAINHGMAIKRKAAFEIGAEEFRKPIIGAITDDLLPQAGSSNTGNGTMTLLNVPNEYYAPYCWKDQTFTFTFTDPNTISVSASVDGAQLEWSLVKHKWKKDYDNQYQDESGTHYNDTEIIKFDFIVDDECLVIPLYATNGMYKTTSGTRVAQGRYWGNLNTRLMPGIVKHLNNFRLSVIPPVEPEADDEFNPTKSKTENPTGSGKYIYRYPGMDTTKRGRETRAKDGRELIENTDYYLHRGMATIELIPGRVAPGTHIVAEFEIGGDTWTSDDGSLMVQLEQGDVLFDTGDTFTLATKPQAAFGDVRTRLKWYMDSTQTEIEVVHPTLLSANDVLTIDDEQVQVSSVTRLSATWEDYPDGFYINNDLWTNDSRPDTWDAPFYRYKVVVTRGYNSTTQAAHSQDAVVTNVTAGQVTSPVLSTTVDLGNPVAQIEQLLLNTDYGMGETGDYKGFSSSQIRQATLSDAYDKVGNVGISLRHAFVSIENEVTIVDALLKIMPPLLLIMTTSADGQIDVMMHEPVSAYDTVPSVTMANLTGAELSQDQDVFINSLAVKYGHDGREKTKNLQNDASIADYGKRVHDEVRWPGIETEADANMAGQMLLAKRKAPHKVLKASRNLAEHLNSAHVGDAAKVTTRDVVGGFNSKRMRTYSESVSLKNGTADVEYVDNNIVGLNNGPFASNVYDDRATTIHLEFSITNVQTYILVDEGEAQYIGCPTKAEYDAGTTNTQIIQIESEQMEALYWEDSGGYYDKVTVTRGYGGTSNVTHGESTLIGTFASTLRITDHAIKLNAAGLVVKGDILVVSDESYQELLLVTQASSNSAWCAINRINRDRYDADDNYEPLNGLSSDFDLGDTSISVSLPPTWSMLGKTLSVGDCLVLVEGSDVEIVELTSGSGTTFNVARGLFGTIPHNFTSASAVVSLFTESHAVGDSISKKMVVDVVTNPEAHADATTDAERKMMFLTNEGTAQASASQLIWV